MARFSKGCAPPTSRSVKDKKLIESAINGMLRSLDPHSSYMNAETFREMQVQTRGEFGGLGIEVTMDKGYVKVVSPIDDTPAHKAGVQAGDLITHIDGDRVFGMTLRDAVKRMRGRVGSKIKITVRRGTQKPFDITIVRAVIKIRSVRSRVEGNVIYVRITTFSEQTAAGLRRAMERHKTELGDKWQGVVLDLRNNPGGLLDQAVAVSDAFLDKGEIVSTRGRQEGSGSRYNAKPGRSRRHQAGHRSDQLGVRVGFRDRRRCASGPPPGNRHGHQVLRQGLCPDDHSAGRPGRHAPDDRALLHTLRQLDPGEGRDARYHRRAGPCRDHQTGGTPAGSRPARRARHLQGQG